MDADDLMWTFWTECMRAEELRAQARRAVSHALEFRLEIAAERARRRQDSASLGPNGPAPLASA